METFSYDDQIVRMFLLATLAWALVSFMVGIIAAIELAFPSANTLLSVISGGAVSSEYLTFGRLRPLHTNTAIFAFAGNTIFAGIYYSTQRLCQARMFSDLLSRLHFWGWQIILVSAAVTLPMGITQGKAYAELEWPIDIAIAVVWLVIFGGNFMMTLLRRRERYLYVALWFYIATIVTVAMLHIVGNLVVPVFGGMLIKSYPIYAGVQDAFMQWWYGHNVVGFFLTIPFLGLMYYFLPRAAERPVYSYRLCILHFWSLVFIYIWAGPHRLHYTALPEWASTLGMLFSVMLWMPSWGGVANGLLTLRGAWHKVAADPVLKFFVAAIIFYGLNTLEAPVLAIKSVSALSHYTDWTIAQVHVGTLGWNGFMAFGVMYYLLPRLFQTGLYSNRLVETHFWLGMIGVLLYVIPIYAAGFTQSMMWRGMTGQGQLIHPDFMESVTRVFPMYFVRIIGGTCYMLGTVLGAYNYYKTWRSRPAAYDVPVHEAPALVRIYEDGPRPTPRIDGVTENAGKIDTWMQLRWHRKWERLPVRFTLWIIIAVVSASLFEIVPMLLIRSNVPTVSTVSPYTPLELAGRDIYITEGCHNCHSQMVRPIISETIRYGRFSKPGEFVFDHPFQWGSRRIGPDLAREGGKQSHLWHVLHLKDPSRYTPGSIMPPYPWLFEKDLDYKSIPLRIKAMMTLGVPYTQKQRDNAVDLARTQAQIINDEIIEHGGPIGLEDKQVVALIAYLQRLGTDIHKTPAIQAEGEPAAPADGGGG